MIVLLQHKNDVGFEGYYFQLDVGFVSDEIEDIGCLFAKTIQRPDNLGGQGWRNEFVGENEQNFFTVTLQESVWNGNVVADQVLDEVMGTNQGAAVGADHRNNTLFDPAIKSLLRNGTNRGSLSQVEIFEFVRNEWLCSVGHALLLQVSRRQCAAAALLVQDEGQFADVEGCLKMLFYFMWLRC